MARVVSLTPSRVDRDSRTYKQAASMARLGHDSVVVEAQRSALDCDLPFTLHRPGGAPAAEASAVGPTAPPPPPVRAWRALPAPARRAVERALRVPLTIALYLRAERETAASLPVADLYWLHGYHQFPAVWLAARRQRAPFVYDAHDYYAEIIEGGATGSLEGAAMRAFWRAVDRLCTRAAAEVVTVSDGLA